MSVYVLLVGIDEYRAPLRRLRGCRRDVEAAAAYFEEYVPEDGLHQLCLIDGQATRAAVIAGFRDHLGRARAGDTALFWFSGHGSQAPVPPGLAATEPTGRMQTLVCADSRVDGVPDLFDKEVAVLIAEVVARGAHLVSVFDSCHADGADREGDLEAGAPRLEEATRVAARWAPPADSAPPASALLSEAVGARSAGVLGERPGYIALAACRRDQTAQEVRLAGGHRGAFSLAVLNQLERLGPDATYRELMAGACCYVENLVSRQTPVLFPIAEPIVDQRFLGGAARPPRSTMTMRWVRTGWEVDAGACHGMAAGDAVGTGEDEYEAEVIRVDATKSLVRPLGGRRPDARRQYPVRVTKGTLADLDHIARWRRVKALENPSSRIAGAIRIEVSTSSGGRVETDETGCVVLEYAWDGLRWIPPEVFIALRNTSDRTLYCVLLDLTDRFRSHIGLLPGALVAAGHTAWAGEGAPIVFSLPDGEEPVPGAAVTDWLKVVVAEEPFNAAPYVLAQLGDRAPAPVLVPVPLPRDGKAAPRPGDWTTAIVPVITRVPSPPP